ncbi:MAG: AMP-binding protein [Kiritimatiellales bacterium]|nr:AMP-binding protein [Kiritimatiellales bacterium]
MDFMQDNIADAILAAGGKNDPAVLQSDGMLSYGELRDQVNRVACGLLNTSSKGARIGILSENSFFWVAAYLGIIHAGRTAVPLSGDVSGDTLAYLAEITEMKVIFVSKRLRAKHRDALNELGLIVITETDELPEATSEPMPPIEPQEDLAAIMFTSGSTGTPKGVMVTHRNIACNTTDIVEYMGLTASDRVMVVLPFHYCFGVSLLHTHLMAGGSVVLNNQFMYPETVLDDMAEKHCTGLAGVPSTYQILLRRSTFRKRSLPALHWFQQAGGKLPDPFIREIRKSFGSVNFFLMYGQTEATARLSYLPPDRLEDKLGSIGKGLPSTRLEVLKENGSPVAPGTDELGEIVASGDNVTKGYWQDAVETENFFRDGKLRTGDMARVDADGFIFVQDRARDFIKSKGNRVGAKELENVIAELPEVVEVAVIGVPHETLGEAIKAFVVAARGTPLTAEDIRRHCAEKLPAFKIPEAVEFLAALPKNSAGKVLKPKLREQETN